MGASYVCYNFIYFAGVNVAYIRDSSYAASNSVKSMPNHEADDLLLYFTGKDSTSGGAWTTPSGYSELHNLQSASVSAACFTKIATSSSEAIPVSTVTSGSVLFCVVIAVADVDTSDFINDSNIATKSGNQHTATAMTTDEDNTLNIWWHVNDSVEYPSAQPGLMSVGIGLPQPVNSNAQASASWTFQYDSGTSVTPVFHLLSVDTGIIISVAVNSSNSSPIIAPHCSFDSPPSDIISPLRGPLDTTGSFGGGTVDPSADLGGGLGPLSVPFNYQAFSNVQGGGISGLAPAHQVDTPSSSSAEEVWGAVWNLSVANVDLTGKRVCCHVSVPASNIGALNAASEGGFIVGVRTDDGGGNAYRLWNTASIDSRPSPLSQHAVVFDVDDSAIAWDDVGTVDESEVSGIFLSGYKGSASDMKVLFTEFHALNPNIIRGGISTFPATVSVFVDALVAPRILTIANQSGSSEKQLFSMHDLQVGDGIESIYFEDTNASIEFAQTASATDKRLQYTVDEDKVGISFLAVTGDTIIFTNSSLSGATTWNFSIHASATSAATWDFSGLAVINANVVLRDVFTALSGMSFIDCPVFTANSADLTGGCTFDNTLYTATSEAEFGDIANCTFSNRDGAGESAILITGNQSHTGSGWADPNLTVSNNTYDIEYTGTTNFSIQSANTLTVNNSSSGVCTIVTPVQTLTINSDTASTLIRYFEDDSQTVVDSTTGTTLDYDYPDTDVIDIELVKQSYVPVNRQDVTPYDGDYDVIMDFDEAYNSSHGLTITTEYDYVRATKVLTINSDQAALDVRSSLADVIRTNSGYYNTPLLMVAIPGLTRVDLTDGMTITSMATWKGAGMEMFDAADSSNPLEKWCSIKSGGFITGATTHYRQTDSGSSTALTLTNDVVDEAFQYWDDPNHDGSTADGYDYSDYMVIKAFLAGYKQARSDVLVDAGVSALASNAYQIVLANEAHAYSGSDPGISGDLTLVTGGVVGGKTFAYEWVDGGVNTGEDIADQINYNAANNPNTTIPGGTGLTYFELGNMVVHNASAVETERGYEEGTTPTLVGFYCSRSSADHPDFTRFQADDGTYYTPAVTSNISITGMPAAGNEIRLQIHNETAKTASAWAGTTAYAQGDKVLRSTGIGTELTAGLYFVATTGGTSSGSEPTWDTTVGNTTADGTVTWTTYAILYHDDDPAGTGYADSYTDGEEFASGDTYRIRFAELNTTTSFKIFETTAIVSSTGFSVVVNEEADAVYALNGVDGSSATVTNKFSPDYSNNEIDLDTNSDFAVTEAFAYYCYELTTSEGMYTAWGGVTAIDTGNYRNNTSVFSLYFDETAGFVKQTDSARWFRSDDTRPARDPTTGGNGIEINWRNPVYAYDGGGGGFTSGDRATLDAAATQASVTAIPDDVWDEAQSGHTTAGTFGYYLDAQVSAAGGGGGDATEAKQDQILTELGVVDGNVDSILTDTGTTLPAQISGVETKIDTVDTNVDSVLVDTGTTLPAQISGVETKVDTVDTNVDAVLVDTGTTLPAQIDGVETKIDTVDSNVDGVKAKTDSLTFTKANELDSNIQSVNDEPVGGTGASGDEWGPE